MSRHGSVAEFLQGGVAGIASMVCIGLLAVPMVVESPETKGAARENERALSVNFSPPSGTHFLVANPAIQVSGCDTFYDVEDAIITVNGNGASYSTQPPGSGNCTTSESRRFDITSPGLSPGANTVVAVVFNANGDEQTGSATYYYDLYALQVAGGMEKTVTPGSSGSVSFFVFNTGGSAANADLSVTCGGLANCTITGQDPLPLNPQQSKEVVVNFTAGLSDGDPVITLTATYVESPSTTANASVVVHVRTPVDHVVVQPSPVQVAVSQSTAVTATVYDANNNVLSGRTVSWSVGNSSIATVNPSTGRRCRCLVSPSGRPLSQLAARARASLPMSG